MGHDQPLQRLRLSIRGAVQGVGFRPFVFRLAERLKLSGFVCNTNSGVDIEIEGLPDSIACFRQLFLQDIPVHAAVTSIEYNELIPTGVSDFKIIESRLGVADTWVAADISMCADCRREVFDLSNRRFRYPFTNCMHCGPRFSIIEKIPYDRKHISMKKFVMCADCQHEYDDPENRRFHAQPNACPACGPKLALWNHEGRVLADKDQALSQAVSALKAGKILAVKGIGGFHLLVDASSDDAVERLRDRKRRYAKPLAVMFPDLKMVKACCTVFGLEEQLLTSSKAPIVLVRAMPGAMIASSVAPGNPYLGVMLPYTPLHDLLLNDFGRAVVATSGNLADETICIDEQEALKRLAGVADFFLVHDRPIVRAVDDSLVHVVGGKEQVLRRSRGYAPLPVTLKHDLPTTLALGGHLKNTIALSRGKDVFLSQHMGDLESLPSLETFKQAVKDLPALFEGDLKQVVFDLHPDYFSTRHAKSMGVSAVQIQHHQAHVFSCMADNGILPPVLGVSWDGSGYGLDKTVWGGEFFTIKEKEIKRFAFFEPFYLLGSEAAVREPRRALLGALFGYFGTKVFDASFRQLLTDFNDDELKILKSMLEKEINTPRTSSVGRRFDALAALLGLGAVSQFEGQAAMALEFALPDNPIDGSYGFRVLDQKDDGAYVIKAPFWDEIIDDVKRQIPVSHISAKFHYMLVEIIIWAAHASGMNQVALSGGCFQNRYLSEYAICRLREEGFKPYWHRQVPPNDGGLALGQIAALGYKFAELGS